MDGGVSDDGDQDGAILTDNGNNGSILTDGGHDAALLSDAGSRDAQFQPDANAPESCAVVDLNPGFPLRYPVDGQYRASARSVVADGLGGVWVVGTIHRSQFPDMALWHFDAQGALRMGFPMVYDSHPDETWSDEALSACSDGAHGLWVLGRSYPRAGPSSGGFQLFHYGADGQLMDGFPRVYDGPGYDALHMACDPGGGLSVTGTILVNPVGSNLALWRFDAEGNLRSGFPTVVEQPRDNMETTGLMGRVVVPDGMGGSWIQSVMLVWEMADSLLVRTWLLWRFSSDGALSDGFPIVTEDTGSAMMLGLSWPYDQYRPMTADGLGGVWVAGYVLNGAQPEIALWRYGFDGDLLEGYPVRSPIDYPEFDPNGVRVSIKSVSLDDAGGLWIAGQAGRDDDVKIILWRFTAVAELVDGYPIIDLSPPPIGQGREEHVSSMAVDGQGGVWVGGDTYPFVGRQHMSLWRFGCSE